MVLLRGNTWGIVIIKAGCIDGGLHASQQIHDIGTHEIMSGILDRRFG